MSMYENINQVAKYNGDQDYLNKENEEELQETLETHDIGERKYFSDPLEDDEKVIELLNNSSRRSLLNRIFGNLGPGSMRGSIFNLTILSLGSGCLSLPKAVSEMSMVMAIISIILTSLATFWTLSLLGIACEKIKLYNYSKVVRKLYGKKLGVTLDVCIFIYIIGILILYQVVSKFKFFKE